MLDIQSTAKRPLGGPVRSSKSCDKFLRSLKEHILPKRLPLDCSWLSSKLLESGQDTLYGKAMNTLRSTVPQVNVCQPPACEVGLDGFDEQDRLGNGN